ncbi:MAG: ABC transporter ATP-binding protein, partial [bacterium]
MMNKTHDLDALHQDEPPLVRVRDVGKIFCADLKRSLLYGLGDGFGELLARRSARKSAPDGSQTLRRGEFWANRGITFDLKRGECLGLIGRNGAGKTTLLKMLNGLIKPDEGIIEMRGRVGAIIALGAGFNPLLTGRENVYVNASLLGLSKREIDEKFDEIVDFAEIGTFIDAPVQSYSSGMQVRLGFAIATSTEPDVLLLDEVLAVGDHSFQSKCMTRISSLIGRCAVIFVSHQEHLVQRLCDRVLWLSQGRVIADGLTREILTRYLDSGDDRLTGIPSASLHANIASVSAVMS